MFAIRNWSAEAFNAILASQEFQEARAVRMRELTTELANTFKLFLANDSQWNWFCRQFQDKCIGRCIPSLLV